MDDQFKDIHPAMKVKINPESLIKASGNSVKPLIICRKSNIYLNSENIKFNLREIIDKKHKSVTFRENEPYISNDELSQSPLILTDKCSWIYSFIGLLTLFTIGFFVIKILS